MKLASLNMKGRSSMSLDGLGRESNKWTLIPALLRRERISILALQETHLEQNHKDNIDERYSKSMKVYNSADPEKPGAQNGVAFVINKELANTNNVTFTELIPGRAILLTTKWHQEELMTVLNVYAPNDHGEQERFWPRIGREIQQRGLPRPSFMIGDFNLVEEAKDRAPSHPDSEEACDALRDIRLSFNLQDVWRTTYPNKREFTFQGSGPVFPQSRIDRIYANADILQDVYECTHAPPPIPTDHWMTTTKYTCQKLPFVGGGRYTVPLFLTSNDEFIKQIADEGIKMTEQARETHRTHDVNPQTQWKDFKGFIVKTAKKAAKREKPKIERKIERLRKDIAEANQKPGYDEDANERWRNAIARSEIEHLEKKRAKTSHNVARARWAERRGTVEALLSKQYREETTRFDSPSTRARRRRAIL
jgi:hypothetical protein